MIGGLIRGVDSVSAGLSTAQQTSDSASKLLVYENIYKRIDSGIACHQNDRCDVGNISIVLRRTEVVEGVNGQVWHPT